MGKELDDRTRSTATALFLGPCSNSSPQGGGGLGSAKTGGGRPGMGPRTKKGHKKKSPTVNCRGLRKKAAAYSP
ncbi:hypothetical protein WIW50_13925, partial [Flavobacteriaceae bacterium 3-367]|uniref:hypothetical protein n=1 Tax=Eudoraea algarum TaxID=3417568 RepID=UPI00328E0F04